MAERDRDLAGPGIMLISAVLFGYFGFAAGLGTISPITGQPVLMWQILVWTLRASAAGFAIAAGLAFAAPRPANLLYALVGLAGAVLFVVVIVMDLLDKQHASSTLLLALFAAWNGYGSWTGLRAVLARRGGRGRDHADAGRRDDDADAGR